ncbi:MAG: binding domain protein [Herbaspirillum sp.]|nr:binding domain protein [Herbaspirillum sp.]
MQLGLWPRVIDQAEHLASSWRNHYERLHLHTVKSHSALPGMPFPKDYPRYVPRQAMVDYMVAYAERYKITPDPGQQVVAVTPAAGGWQTVTQTGRCYVSGAVVVATGANSVPIMPAFANQAQFTGHIMHSCAYRNALPFSGQRVLVVGMGNTGAEIALDLAEHGAQAHLSVRSPLNIVYRDVLGRPTQLTVDANGMPTDVIGRGALEGVYFVGFDIRAPGGLLRTIGIQAQSVADEIGRKRRLTS